MKNLGQFVLGIVITSKGGQFVHPFYITKNFTNSFCFLEIRKSANKSKL